MDIAKINKGSSTVKKKSKLCHKWKLMSSDTENPAVRIKMLRYRHNLKLRNELSPLKTKQKSKNHIHPNCCSIENTSEKSKNPTNAIEIFGKKNSVILIESKKNEKRKSNLHEKVQLWVDKACPILGDSVVRKSAKGSTIQPNASQPESTNFRIGSQSANFRLDPKSANLQSSTQPKLTCSPDKQILTALSKSCKKKKLTGNSHAQKSTNFANEIKSTDSTDTQLPSFQLSPQPPKSKRGKFKNSRESSLRARMLSRLSAARFRFINQELYAWDGRQSTDLAFSRDPKTFKAYHSGFRQQTKLWPVNPIDSIIKSIKRMADFQQKVVADFGCGEAKLALELGQNRVHSFDLVALNDRVTVADNANTNLYARSVDIAVHCLSLMSANISAYLREANRVLKVGGILKIAEVESRFENVDKFVDDVAKFNFRLVKKDLSKNLFYFLDFEKTADIGVAKKRKLPNLSLLPCLYKKR